jgi:hypothetical protein
MTARRLTGGAISLQSLKPFLAHGEINKAETGHVGAGMRKVGDKSLAERISHLHEHDRKRRGFMAQGGDRRRCIREDDVGLEADQLCRLSLETFEVAAGPAIFEAGIPPIDPAEFPEPSGEGLLEGLCFRIRRVK